jgi:hypothetical protein
MPTVIKRELNRGRLRIARAHAYIGGMNDVQYLTKKLKAAERELDAATARMALNAAAKRLMRAKEVLKRLELAGSPGD